MKKLQGRIIRIIDLYEVMINLGSKDFIERKDSFRVLGGNENIVDPVSGVTLGAIRSVKGYGSIVTVFENFSIASLDQNFDKSQTNFSDPIVAKNALIDINQIEPFRGRAEKIQINDEVIMEIPDYRSEIGTNQDEIPF